MVEEYRNTGLWLRSLGSASSSDAHHLTKLNSSFNDFRSKSFQLTAQIAKTLPSLTIHDGTHLDALWETADLIAGPNYPLNPIEGFVLAGAILLHDAALCFEAFDKGQDGLRSTLVWRDCYAASADRNGDADEEYILADADFAALRSLHASQAAKLAKQPWRLPSGVDLYLIEDSDLRQRYGAVIGQIAASHHWSIERVAQLGDQINAPGTFPRDWRVDPVKIACLLRCADAAHIDNRRAPDFLYALSRKQGISGDHWRAQNWLARADIFQADEHQKSLLFTSNCDFEHPDANAWWVAYDAISLVDAEIKSSNYLLGSRENRRISPPFRVEKVVGANSPEELSTFVRATGWKPCSARIHVSNLEKLVKDLGGTQLYGDGDRLSVALREILQNSRDAIVARRSLDNEFIGKIRVRLFRSADQTISLQIEDNGIGMSERVMTGPLLDFGTSFWISNLVQEEFPGLRSSSFRSIGRFGIGFYSVFMVADAVTISSRRWDDAHTGIRTLSFPFGLSLRPILSSGPPEGFSGRASTVVTLSLEGAFSADKIKVMRGRVGEADFYIDFPAYLAALACGIDVDVEFIGERDTTPQLVHTSIQNITSLKARTKWLNNLAFTAHLNTNLTNQIERFSNRLRFIDEKNKGYGLAALSAHLDGSSTFLSMSTIGGLATSIHSRGSDRFIGFIDFLPNSAKRDAKNVTAASIDMLEAWSKEQIEILRAEGVRELEWACVTCNLSDLMLDPYEVCVVLMLMRDGMYFQSLEDLFELASTSGVAVYKASFGDHVETHMNYVPFESYPTLRPIMSSAFLSFERDEQSGRAKHTNSFLSCLERFANNKGFSLHYEKKDKVVQSTFGPIDAVIITARQDMQALM